MSWDWLRVWARGSRLRRQHQLLGTGVNGCKTGLIRDRIKATEDARLQENALIEYQFSQDLRILNELSNRRSLNQTRTCSFVVTSLLPVSCFSLDYLHSQGKQFLVCHKVQNRLGNGCESWNLQIRGRGKCCRDFLGLVRQFWKQQEKWGFKINPMGFRRGFGFLNRR